MAENEFRALVAQMREAQRRWFSTKNQDALTQAKQLEKRVDAELAAKNDQQSLFDR